MRTSTEQQLKREPTYNSANQPCEANRQELNDISNRKEEEKKNYKENMTRFAALNAFFFCTKTQLYTVNLWRISK